MPFFILAFGHTLLSLAMAVHRVSHRRRRQWHVICENRLNSHAAEETDFQHLQRKKRRLASFPLAATLPLHYDNSTFYFHIQVKCTLWFCSSVIIISHRAPPVLSDVRTRTHTQTSPIKIVILFKYTALYGSSCLLLVLRPALTAIFLCPTSIRKLIILLSVHYRMVALAIFSCFLFSEFRCIESTMAWQPIQWLNSDRVTMMHHKLPYESR